MIEIYTDGSCRGNGKASNDGGFGAVVLMDGKLVQCYARQSKDTTNNREEMKAILWAICTYAGHKDVTIYTDSKYAYSTFTEWRHTWERNGWLTSSGKTPENMDLVMAYRDLIDGLKLPVNLVKIKGHTGSGWNEVADFLATGRITPEEARKTYG